MEQGVLQLRPVDVRASAPDGMESRFTCTGGGVDLKLSNENEEQPARLTPARATTRTRRMTVTQIAANCHNPRADLRSVTKYRQTYS